MPRPHAAANDFGTLHMTDSTTSSDVLKVTLLGTGIPNPQINAFGTSTLIEAGDQKVLIDCGRGAAIRNNNVVNDRLWRILNRVSTHGEGCWNRFRDNK